VRKKAKIKKQKTAVYHLSPFRYPGGKSWFVKTTSQWLQSRNKSPSVLVEPFAGGCGVSLAAVYGKLAKKAVFSEIDKGVAATWKTMLNGHAQWLANKIVSFQMSRARLQRVLNASPRSDHGKAFQCILRNRTARGGVLAEGAGLIREGENGKGLQSRWYPETLAFRIKLIATISDKLEFQEEDAFQLIKKFRRRKSAVFFVDPPYTKAARRLYNHWQIDHEKLFKALQRVKGDVLMTYDDTKEVRRLAKKYGFKTKSISMKTTHHMNKKELMISRKFDWFKPVDKKQKRPKY
jgi:DNA adenine methylase